MCLICHGNGILSENLDNYTLNKKREPQAKITIQNLFEKSLVECKHICNNKNSTTYFMRKIKLCMRDMCERIEWETSDVHERIRWRI